MSAPAVNRFCARPDRDVPKVRCGYPLPCPWHDAPPTAMAIVIPATGTVVAPLGTPPVKLRRLAEIGRALRLPLKRGPRRRPRKPAH